MYVSIGKHLRTITLLSTVCVASSVPSAWAVSTPNPACILPTSPASVQEQTAWQIFAAINCSQGGKLAWESWTEQTCLLNPSTPGCNSQKPTHFLHPSVLRAGTHTSAGGDPKNRLGGDCNPMTVKGVVPSASDPFVPANLSAQPAFCEEVFVNKAELDYINAPSGSNKPNLLTLTGQANYINTKAAIQFPTDAIELKVDWLPATSLQNVKGKPAFDCNKNKPAGVYVEQIEGKCYALVGIHISSKLYPNWLWATFEPQNSMTNPNRCKSNLYSSCSDAWGSNPAVVNNPSQDNTPTTQTSQLTPAAQKLLKEAGLAPEFFNYRLVGTQTEFNNPAQLGNSFTEFNAGVAPQKSSCITCHGNAVLNAAVKLPQGNQNFGPFPGFPSTGAAVLPAPTPGQWNSQDFSWLLGIMLTK